MNKTRYERYMKSPAWKTKRDARLAIDGHKCRMCDEDGTRYALQVHHRPDSYKRLGEESVENDLTTVCTRCHDLITNAIREDRYGKKELPTITYVSAVERTIEHVTPNRELPANFVSAPHATQRPTSGPAKQVVEVNQGDFLETKEDRRRLSRDGAS